MYPPPLVSYQLQSLEVEDDRSGGRVKVSYDEGGGALGQPDGHRPPHEEDGGEGGDEIRRGARRGNISKSGDLICSFAAED